MYTTLQLTANVGPEQRHPLDFRAQVSRFEQVLNAFKAIYSLGLLLRCRSSKVIKFNVEPFVNFFVNLEVLVAYLLRRKTFFQRLGKRHEPQ